MRGVYICKIQSSEEYNSAIFIYLYADHVNTRLTKISLKERGWGMKGANITIGKLYKYFYLDF